MQITNLIINKKSLTALVLWGSFCFLPLNVFAVQQQKVASDSTTKEKTQFALKQTKKNFLQKVLAFKPIHWIASNWSAYDPRYSTPSFYHWAAQLQDNIGKEFTYFKMDGDGTEFKMRSRTSNKLGPYFSYDWLGYGLNVDVNALFSKEKGKSKSEFGLSINSNLFNIDLFRRRTGGDYIFSKFIMGLWNPATDEYSQHDYSFDIQEYDLGSMIKTGVTGININYFVNHKKYSNPAAFSNGAIQLRSVGSPIIGIGFTNSTFDFTTNEAYLDGVSEKMQEIKEFYTIGNGNIYNKDWEGDLNKVFQELGYKGEQDGYKGFIELFANDPDKYYSQLGKLIKNPLMGDYLFGHYDKKTQDYDYSSPNVLGYLLNSTPSTIRINDLHLQVGYAYNLVFSKRLLLGISIIASPSIKWIKAKNDANVCSRISDDIATALNNHFGLTGSEFTYSGSDFHYDVSTHCFGVNGFGRASLTYNYNRWRAGFNLSANAYFFNKEGVTMNNGYGNCNIYVGYCFGRKKQYRYNGKNRQAYIMAALSKSEIEEMKDTMPQGNVSKSASWTATMGKPTKYKTDNFNINIFGSDLCKGPSGQYGTYQITDGFVTEGEDTEGRLRKGNVLPIDKDGKLQVYAGHKNSFRAGNWWKSHIEIHQTPTNWYPEMLHYSLKGNLTLWLRNHQFGTNEPVKVVIPNFYINHGTETKEFFQIAANGFESHSAYSIVGNAEINGRMFRIYIESKNRGKKLNVYVNKMRKSTTEWMKAVDNSRPISQVDIPGTHDAGTASLPEGPITSQAHTQNFTIAEQVYDGIRAFDIRLKGNMKFGHTLACREGLDDTMKEIAQFLRKHPSEFLVMLMGSDEGGKWSEEMKQNYMDIINQYPELFVENFENDAPISSVRGKILVLKRQEACPFGKLIKFSDNAVFTNNGFCIEDVYKEHKTYKKIKLVEEHLRNAFEDSNTKTWYWTFNSIAWDPRHHKPYYSAWGAVNVRKPMNKALREVLEEKAYSQFGIIFLDFYSDHGDNNRLVERIISTNFNPDKDNDFLTKDELQ